MLTVDALIAAGDRWIPEQIDSEFRSLLMLLAPRRVRHVVELGVRRGGTAAVWHALSTGTVVGVDLPSDFSRMRAGELEAAYPRFRSVLGDSHDLRTLAAVKLLLGGDPIDFLFVDGDHTYEGAKCDWEMYRPLVAPGGIVAFHDVADTPYLRSVDNTVYEFWAELRATSLRTEEYNAGGEWGGIGVVFA